ncbi:hypothetical protein D3C80_598810 [compost metagenome]
MLFAVFGEQANAVADGRTRVAIAQQLAIQANAAGSAALGAEQGAHGFGAARADQATETQHFAGTHLEADIAHQRPGAQPLDLQTHLAQAGLARRKQIAQLTADHHLHQASLINGRQR